MSNEIHARRLLALLHQGEEESPEPPPVLSARETRVVDAMLHAARPRSAVGPAVLGAVGAALTVAAGVGWFLLGTNGNRGTRPVDAYARVTSLAGSATIVASDQTRSPVRPGRPLGATDRLFVPTGATVSLALPSGAAARATSSTELAFDGSHPHREQLTLARGTVMLEVPRLPSHQTLAVATPHATVTVVGTRFAVSVVRAADTEVGRSCVSVETGRVQIAAAGRVELLGFGQQWSSHGQPCHAATSRPGNRESAAYPHGSASPSAEPGVLPNPSRNGRNETRRGVSRSTEPLPSVLREQERVHPTTSTTPATAAFDVSTLERQNRLFGTAMEARRVGDNERALELLEQLLREHPDSPLAAEAQRERAAIMQP